MADSTTAESHDRGFRTTQSASANGSVFEMYGSPAIENDSRAEEEAHPRSNRSTSLPGSPIAFQRRPRQVRNRPKVTTCGQKSHGYKAARSPGTMATGSPTAFHGRVACVR